jgi:predicted ATPase
MPASKYLSCAAEIATMARPQEAASFRVLREQARNLAIVLDHLQQIAAVTTEAKFVPASLMDRVVVPPAPRTG